VDLAGEWPAQIHPRIHIFDEERIKVHGHHIGDLLLDHIAEHLFDEFVPGQNEADPLGTPLPDAITHQHKGGQTSFADIRYLVPLIPLALFVEALFLASILNGKNKTLLVLAVLVSGTNLFQLQFFRTMEFRSFFLDRIGEIIRPPAEP